MEVYGRIKYALLTERCRLAMARNIISLDYLQVPGLTLCPAFQAGCGEKMIKQYIIENWLVKPAQDDIEHITRSQVQAAWARILFAIASMAYLYLHAVFFAEYMIPLILFFSTYLAYNALSIISIRHTPLSAFRTLFAPIFDTTVICTGMMADGGHGSGMFFILFLPIIGNSFRFGNALMFYTQALSFIGLGSIGIYPAMNPLIESDSTLLVWQFFGLLSIPFYVYLIREKAEKAIRGQVAAEKAAITLLDHGPMPVFAYNLDDKKQPHIMYANEAILDILPDHHAGLIGMQPDVLTLPEDSDVMLNFCRTALLQNQQNGSQSVRSNMYIRGQEKSGNILRLLCSVSRLRWRERWIGICFILDITKREILQEQLDAMHRQGFMSTLVAGIVHDFRNVLTNMIGYAEVIQMDSSNDISKKQLSAIIDAGERGSGLVTHLLKLSKNNVSKLPGQYTEGGELEQPLDNIIGLARLQLPSHVKLHCKIDKPLHDVKCSTIEIEQILLNLINNATQALSGPGHIQVNIHNDYDHPVAKNGQPALCIEVLDDGAGIAEENLGKIFDPFWTSREVSGGSGLGLTMVQRIVKLHHGSIHVKSDLNQGACFTIHLPPYTGETTEAAEPDTNAPAPTMADSDQPLTAGTAYHILLVDDARDILEIHKAMLARMRHTSSTAENGKQALELFLKGDQHFDMIITDFRMPVMNGLELIEAIRLHDTNIPILMITAFGEDGSLQRVGNMGATLMNKPVTLKKLRETIAETMDSTTS
jgi:PAS domain S-box-containing protein